MSRTAQALAALTLTLGALSSAQASAVLSKTFFFSANCIDCAQAAHTSTYQVQGELTVSGSTQLGATLTSSNFVSFVYRGSNLLGAFSISTSGNDGDATTTDYTLGTVLGVLPSSLPGAPIMSLSTSIGGGRYVSIGGDGSWALCMVNCVAPTAAPVVNNDFGTGATLSNTAPTANPTPEPGSLALSALALLGLGAVRRARRA